MKKVRRGATADEEDNAVDVFGGATLSQDELLAAALGEDIPPPEPKLTKKKKKPKKGTLIDEQENAVDVFGGAQLSQEELLAQALGDTPEPEPEKATVSKKGKTKKKSKKAVLEHDDNAVDVFGDASMTQEQLLATALGESNDDIQLTTKSPKNKKKGGKKTTVEEENRNAVDVFGSVGKTQEELLTEAMGTSDGRSVDEDSNRTTEHHPVSNGISHEETNSIDILGSSESDGQDGLREVIAADESATADVTESDSQDDNDTDEDALEDAPGDDFEPETEVVSEFEKVAEEFEGFTRAGRRKTSKVKSAQTQSPRRLGDPRFANFGSGGEKYTSVRLEDITMTFRSTDVLNGVTWGVQTGERVGLIGENGCGKTTQLRIMAGLMEPTSGEVVTSSSRTKASFLRQEFVDELDPRRTLREEFMAAFGRETSLLKEYTQCEQDISEAGEDLERLETLLNRLEDIREECDQTDAWNLDSRIDKIMPGLGFEEDDNDKLVASFSGGWKVRIGLGKVLLQDPDLLLLDEPSNHLDSESVEWLEEFLQTCKLPMVVVSHDREFLDRVCTKIVEIEGGEAFEYPGNYSRYVKLRKEQRQAWEAAYERQQKFIKEQQNYIKRNRKSNARSGQVKSRQKMLERMERTGQMVVRPPRTGKPLTFRFPRAPRSGRDCIVVDELTHGYEGKTLFEDASIAIERGDRIALVGPNGCGKSTLLRLITGGEEPQQGTVDCKDLTNISLAYYEQNQADALDLDITVLETLKKAAPPEMRYEEIRALLGKFLFKGDDVEKTVGALSGGEKARLALAKIMLEPANVLVLDEPGNHLSISAKEMLEEALQHFDGTLLLVSHDRYLISQVATGILAVEDSDLVLYDGDYKSYMEKNEDLKERLQARFIPGVAEIKNAPKILLEEPVEAVGKKQKRKKNFGGSGVQSGRTKEMNAKRWNK